MQEIDVEKIMEEIREDIRNKGYKESDLGFSDVEIDFNGAYGNTEYNEIEFDTQIAYMNEHFNNPVFFPISGNPVKAVVQKVVRRLFLFVIFQAFQYQNKFNLSVTKAMNQMKRFADENVKLKEELDNCMKEIEILKKEMENLKKK